MPEYHITIITQFIREHKSVKQVNEIAVNGSQVMPRVNVKG